MKQPQPYRPIKCFNCGKKIAEGSLPALVEIKCPGCGVRNDLAAVAIDGDKRKPFAERLQLEKKGFNPFTDGEITVLAVDTNDPIVASFKRAMKNSMAEAIAVRIKEQSTMKKK